MKFKDEIDKNALLILQKHEEKRSRRYAENSKTQPHQRQHFSQQQKQQQQKGVHLQQLHVEKTQQSNQQGPNIKHLITVLEYFTKAVIKVIRKICLCNRMIGKRRKAIVFVNKQM